MTKKTNDNHLTLEEKDQYSIEVDVVRNHIRFNLYGPLAKAAHIPNYIFHVEEALKSVKDGFTTLGHATTGKNPGFSTTPVFKKSFNMMAEKGLRKAAFVNVKKSVVHKMIIGVLSKLAKYEIKIFGTLEEAEKWLELKREE